MKPTQKSLPLRLIASFAAPLLMFSMTACEVKKTEEGKMPKYEVETPDIEVKEKTITVPDVEIVTPAEKRAEKHADGNAEPEASDTKTPAPAPAEPAPAPAPAP